MPDSDDGCGLQCRKPRDKEGTHLHLGLSTHVVESEMSDTMEKSDAMEGDTEEVESNLNHSIWDIEEPQVHFADQSFEFASQEDLAQVKTEVLDTAMSDSEYGSSQVGDDVISSVLNDDNLSFVPLTQELLKQMNQQRKSSLESEEKPYICTVCGKGYKVKSELNRHQSIHTGENLHTCDICGKGFTKKWALTRHVITHTGTGKYKCETCDRSFINSSDLVRHQQKHTGARPFSCKYCDKTFCSKSDGTRHEMKHTGENMHACVICGKSFPRLYDLTQHQATHTDERPHKCSMCPKTFKLKSDLNRHHRYTHAEDTPYQCPHCDKAFSRKSLLARHEKIHNVLRPFPCDLCHRSFNFRWDLQHHMMTHTTIGPYACTGCDKTFFKKSALARHNMVHTGEKPFYCDVCGKGFYKRGEKVKHMEKFHPPPEEEGKKPKRGKRVKKEKKISTVKSRKEPNYVDQVTESTKTLLDIKGEAKNDTEASDTVDRCETSQNNFYDNEFHHSETVLPSSPLPENVNNVDRPPMCLAPLAKSADSKPRHRRKTSTPMKIA